MSERVTWETCPTCRRPAAVGWLDNNPVEFDCPNQCRLTTQQVRELTDRRMPAERWLTHP